MRAEFGCDGPLPVPRWRIGGEELDRCPMALLGEMDGWSRAVIDLWRDYRQGVIVDWPDRYSAAVVEAVRYLEQEHSASEIERQEREIKRLRRERQR